jgi:hypothetical protein
MRIPPSLNNGVRQIHRWLSIAFTLNVVAYFVARAQGEPAAWITYSPLFPLALLCSRVCTCSCCHMPPRGAADYSPIERVAGCSHPGHRMAWVAEISVASIALSSSLSCGACRRNRLPHSATSIRARWLNGFVGWQESLALLAKLVEAEIPDAIEGRASAFTLERILAQPA